MSSKIREVFLSLCDLLELPKQEIQLLQELGMKSADEFYVRLPSNEKLEEWIGDTVRYSTCEQAVDETWKITDRMWAGQDPHDLDALAVPTERMFGRGSVAASMRRLWEASKAASKRDMMRASEGAQFGGVRQKVGTAVLSDLALRSDQEGM